MECDRLSNVDKTAEWKKKHEEQATYDWQKKKRDAMEFAWLAGGIKSRQVTQAKLAGVGGRLWHARA